MLLKRLSKIVCLVLLVMVLCSCGIQLPEGRAMDDQGVGVVKPAATPGPKATIIPSISPTPELVKELPTSTPPVITPENKPLAGRVICVDPGHQSVMKKQNVPVAPGEEVMMPDFAIGTKGVSTGVFEYTVVLEVSQKLRDSLEELGAEVVMTREATDTLIGSIERAQIANDAQADIFIRIHCDGSDIPEAKGISVLYPGDKYITDKDMLDKSLALSKSVLNSVIKETQAKDRGLSERNDLVGFNYCKVPCTLIEMGFMTNPDEDKLLNSDSYQDKLVKGIVAGISNYLDSE